MDAKIATLETKVENLEDWRDKHERNDEREHKYVANMIEDMLAKMAGIERSAVRFETDLAHRDGQQLGTQESLKEIFNRIRVLERLTYIAIGGIAVIGTVFSIIGSRLLSLLGGG